MAASYWVHVGTFEDYTERLSLRDRHVIHRKIAYMTKALRGAGSMTGSPKFDKKGF